MFASSAKSKGVRLARNPSCLRLSSRNWLTAVRGLRRHRPAPAATAWSPASAAMPPATLTCRDHRTAGPAGLRASAGAASDAPSARLKFGSSPPSTKGSSSSNSSPPSMVMVLAFEAGCRSTGDCDLRPRSTRSRGFAATTCLPNHPGMAREAPAFRAALSAGPCGKA